MAANTLLSARSEEVSVLEALDLVVVGATEWLVDVVGVGDVAGALDFVGAGFALGKDLSASELVLLHHLDAEDVVDFDVMRGEAVVQEVWREHHVVALVPELRVVLRVEEVNVARAEEAEAGEDNHSGPHPNENAGDVDWALGHAEETRGYWAHHGDNLVSEDPVPVDDLEHAAEGVLSVLALSQLVEAEEPSDEAASLGEVVVPDGLESLRVPQQEGLNSLRHINNLL